MPKDREGKATYNDKIKAKQAKEEKAYKDRKHGGGGGGGGRGGGQVAK